MRKLAVVTGGTKGIGRAIIHKFVAQGFDIATCARNEAELTTLREETEAAVPGITVAVFTADAGDKVQAEAFAGFVAKLGRPVDVLVNNAGFFVPGEITTEPEDNLERMMSANMYSAYYITRGLAADMKKRRAGHIFNICSIASIKAYNNGGSYAISKFAMLGFSKCLREELKEYNIRVTAVLPGATRTASWDGTTFPDDRFMPSEDIAEIVWSTYALSGRSVVEEIILRPQLGDI